MFIQAPRVKPIEWVLTRHGREVFRATTEQAVIQFLLAAQPLTERDAIDKAGYQIEPVRG